MSQPVSITVVTPCLNAAATIGECLASVRSQDHPLVEHVVVDGGSTDGTVEMLQRAEGVTWVSEPDGGRADAANKGVAMSSGEVVAWLNADDRYEPGALRAVAEAFAASPGAMWATGYCRIIDAEGNEIRRPVTRYKNVLLRRWSLGLYLTQNFVSDPATFVRRAAFDRVGPISSRWRWSHDYDLWLRVAALGPPLVIERELACFRMAAGSLSMTGFEGQFREHTEVARLHGGGHRLAVAANAGMSRLIVAVYRLLRLRSR
ncbi:MAG: glycosyltransferase family 2 protein [Candidatus Limnocylindria bacterium]